MSDYFYEGLRPGYRQKLAHKVEREGDFMAYLPLVKATCQLESRLGTHAPKSMMDGDKKAIWMMSLFPIWKLKGGIPAVTGHAAILQADVTEFVGALGADVGETSNSDDGGGEHSV